MPGKVNLYNLGTQGVDLTRSIIHAEDGTLRQAQNAVPDMRGEFGGVAKRDGLVNFNSSATGASILGVVPANLPFSESKRRLLYSVNTNVGSQISSLAYTDDQWATQASAPSAAPSPYPPDAQNLTIDDTTGALPPGCPGRGVSIGPTAYWLSTNPSEGHALISAKKNPSGSATDYRMQVVLRIPSITATAVALNFPVAMLANEGLIYAAVTTGVAVGPADVRGSVFRINPLSGLCERLGSEFPADRMPCSLCWYQGKLWAGTYSLDAAADSGYVYWIRPGIDSDWTLDHTSTAGQGHVLALVVYKELLYGAFRGSNTLASLVKVRSTAGVWSTSLTGAATTTNQWFLSLVVFGTNLYASYYKHDATATATIHKFDNSSWTTVTTPAIVTPYMLFAGKDLLVIYSMIPGTAGAYSSTDGTSWTSRTTNFQPAGDTYSGAGMMLEVPY